MRTSINGTARALLVNDEWTMNEYGESTLLNKYEANLLADNYAKGCNQTDANYYVAEMIGNTAVAI